MSGKRGHVREFDSCQGNVGDFTKSQGNVGELSGKNILSGKSCLKLFIINCIFASIQVFSTSASMIWVTLNMPSATEECREASGNFTLSGEWSPCCLEKLEMSGNLTAVRDFTKSQGSIWEKILSGKSGLKLIIISCIIASILDFAELVHFIFVSDRALLHSYPHH